MRFKPQLSAFEFQYLLHNLTTFRISNAGGHNCKCVFVCISRVKSILFIKPNITNHKFAMRCIYTQLYLSTVVLHVYH